MTRIIGWSIALAITLSTATAALAAWSLTLRTLTALSGY